MTSLCIFVQEPLRFAVLADRPGERMTFDGGIYTKRSYSEDDVVFYDWIIDERRIVRALELHLDPDDPLLYSCVPFEDIGAIDSDMFVRIWLSADRTGSPQGKEAFEDIWFFGTGAGALAVVVGLDSWLAASEAKALLAMLNLGPRDR